MNNEEARTIIKYLESKKKEIEKEKDIELFETHDIIKSSELFGEIIGLTSAIGFIKGYMNIK